MRAMYYTHFGELPVIADLPDPDCPSDGVVIQIASSGMCMSDWHGWQGHDPDIQLPHVPGHEFAGTIAEVGSEMDGDFTIGQRVTVPFIQACGHCTWCHRGHSQVCPHQHQAGFTEWGSHAEYVAVSRAGFNLVRLPSDLSFHAASLLGCRYGTAMHAVRMAIERKKNDGAWVVFGCGGVGLSIVQIAASLGQNVVAVDLKSNALRSAKQNGANQVVLADDQVQERIADEINGQVAVTFDAVGSYEIVQQSLACLAPRGMHIQVGLLPGSSKSLSLSKLIAQELEVHGCHGIPRSAYAHLLNFVVEKGIDPAQMIERIVSLPQAVNHFVNHLLQDAGGTMAIDPQL